MIKTNDFSRLRTDARMNSQTANVMKGGDPMESMLAYGDSNTWGLIPGSSPYQRYSYDIRWTGILERKLTNVRVLEEGLCGRTTVLEDRMRSGRNGNDTLPVILESQYPIDFAVLMLGTNDCKKVYSVSPEQIGRGIEQCLDTLERYIGKEDILLISPILLGDHVWRSDKDPEFDRRSVAVCKGLKAIYEQIARKRGIHFMAASDYVTADERDDEHFNEEGHRIFAEAVYAKLQEMKVLSHDRKHGAG